MRKVPAPKRRLNEETLLMNMRLGRPCSGAARRRLNKSRVQELQNEFAQVLVFGDGLKTLFHVGGVDYDLALFHVGRFKTDFV